MPLININHLHEITKAMVKRIPQKAAETAQAAAKEATKQARNAATSNEKAQEAAKNAADQVTNAKQAVAAASEQSLNLLHQSESNAKLSENNAKSSEKSAEAWAQSSSSPDGLSDSSSTTGKTQSAKSWAQFAKQQATAADKAFTKVQNIAASKIFIGEEEQPVTDDNEVKLNEMTDDDLNKLCNMIILADQGTMSEVYPDTYKTMKSISDCIDLNNIETAWGTFEDCFALETIQDLEMNSCHGGIDTFKNCKSLKVAPKIKSPKWVNMDSIFYGCSELVSIPYEIDMEKCVDYDYMFFGCDKLTNVKLRNVSKNFDPAKAGLKDGQYTIVSYRES